MDYILITHWVGELKLLTCIETFWNVFLCIVYKCTVYIKQMWQIFRMVPLLAVTILLIDNPKMGKQVEPKWSQGGLLKLSHLAESDHPKLRHFLLDYLCLQILWWFFTRWYHQHRWEVFNLIKRRICNIIVISQWERHNMLLHSYTYSLCFWCFVLQEMWWH